MTQTPPRSTSPLRWLLVCLLASAVCVGQLGCITIITGGECQSDNDCPQDKALTVLCIKTAQGNKCLTSSTPPLPTQCISDSDCDTFETCIREACIRTKVCECASDTDCQEGMVCQACRCEAPQRVCAQETDCPPGQDCINQRCQQPKDTGCKSSTDCTNNQQCNLVTGKCLDCLQDIDCPIGETCSPDGSCQTNQPCQCKTSLECPGQQRCVGCRCQLLTAPGAVCDDHKPCPTGQNCVYSPIDKNSYCYLICDDDKACQTNQGQKSCIRLSPRTKESYCVEERTEGQSCLSSRKEQAICRKSMAPLLYCDPKSGTCQPSKIAKSEGEVCDGDATLCDWGAGLVCHLQTRICTKGSVMAGEAAECRVGNSDQACLSGLQCIQLGPEPKQTRCMVTCDNQKLTTCQHNKALSCVPILDNGKGVCLQTSCTGDDQCVTQSFSCQTFADGRICLP